MSEIRSQATPAKDELAEKVFDLLVTAETMGEQRRNVIAHAIAIGLEDAGWSKPRTVNDVDQLEALPAGTVLRNNKSGRVFEKARDKGAGKSKWMRMRDRWVYETYEILNGSTWTVLFTPGGE